VRGELVGVRAPSMPLQTDVWISKDDAGEWHLLVEVPAQTAPVTRFASKGLEIAIRELRVGGRAPRNYLDLCCHDPLYQKTFAAVACDIAGAIQTSPEDPRNAVVRSLERWRSFWAVDPAGLSQKEALGLFGELWFMLRWMRSVDRRSIDRWQGPLGARHDFQWQAASIEVKTATAGSRGIIHEIASLDQLDDPETGSLYLFSLHVADDALGANTLPALVEIVFAGLAPDEDAKRLFAERLAKVGYSPGDAERYARRLRVIREELYKVDGSFPRLTRSTFLGGLPTGVEAVSYALDMAACAPWQIASGPSDPAASFLRG